MQPVQWCFSPLISLPHFKSINFYQNRPKIKLFLQKNTKFWALGSAPIPPVHCRFLVQSQPCFCSFLCDQNSPWCHVLKAFYQKKHNIKLFLQKKNLNFSSARGSAPRPPMASGGAYRPPKQPLSHFRFLVTRWNINVCCHGAAHTPKLSNLTMRIYWASQITTAIYGNEVVPLFLK